MLKQAGCFHISYLIREHFRKPSVLLSISFETFLLVIDSSHPKYCNHKNFFFKKVGENGTSNNLRINAIEMIYFKMQKLENE